MLSQRTEVDRASAPAEAERTFFSDTQDRMSLLPNYYRWIAHAFRDQVSGEVLELGIGAGFVLRHYADRVDRVIAVDIDRNLLDGIARTWPADKVRPQRVDLSGDWSEIADVRADAVVALDLLEHFEDDAAFIEKLKRNLRPGGRAVIKVPAQSRLYGAVDQASGHFRRYDKDAFRGLLERAGFRTVSLRHMNPAGAWGYRFKRGNRSSYSQTISPAKLRLVNMLIPALALLDLLPGLQGLSLIGVFELRATASPNAS